MLGRIAVVAYVESEWREVLLDEDQRGNVLDLLVLQFEGKSVPVSSKALSLDAVWDGWHYEDALPDGYPYAEMYERSLVLDGVRKFPPV